MIEPISDRASFARFSSGRRASCGLVRIRFVGHELAPSMGVSPGVGEARGVRVAYAIGRKTGNAVLRNRIRRRLRAALCQLQQEEPGAVASGDYLFSAGPGLAEVPFDDVRRMVRHAVVAVQRAS